ncbi:hypothetical protein KY386_01795 [Candidatus Parcubacteria bacterium]|nr:hypothetical protein [Candidatus Parcubacteria bacterium]
MKRKRLIGGLVTGLLVLGALFFGFKDTVLAYTNQFGRAERRGYFFDVLDCQGSRIYNQGIWVNNVNEFVGFIKDKLDNGGKDTTGAEFIILTMLGFNGGTHGKFVSPAELADWEARVRYYDSQGWVNYNQVVSYNINSAYQGSGSIPSPACPNNPNPDDAMFFDDSGSKPSIVFARPGTVPYIIKKDCGNTLGGNSGGLQPPPPPPPPAVYNNVPLVFGTPPGGPRANPVQVNVGTPLTLNISARNTGTGSSPAGRLIGYEPNSTNPRVTFPHGGIPAGSTIVRSYPYLVPDLPDGTVLCFGGEVSPGRGLSDGSPPAVPVHVYNPDPNGPCYKVSNPRYPFVTTSGGDVHAGGGIGYGINCDANPASPKRIRGQFKSGDGSKAQYVVSAGGNINQFGSRDTPTGTGLTFSNSLPGNLGRYGTVCRPDLITAAERYTGPTAGYSGSLSAAPGTLLTASGSTTVPASVVGNRVTLFVRGDVTITGPITYNPAPASRDAQPSFGIIATGNIFIAPSVQRLDGFYYAGGAIDTCAGVNITTNASACGAQLTVRGLMMANQFKFKRTGPVGTGGPFASEVINFTGLLYVATPPAFSDVITPMAGYPGYQSEKPPVY